jgi:hypothetical protein
VIQARSLAAVIIAVWLITAPGSIRGTSRPVAPGLRLVSSHGVEALVPPKWEYRPLSGMSAEAQKGFEASSTNRPFDVRVPGLQAFWVDATEIRVPSDYYSLAARGPLMDGLSEDPSCRTRSADAVIGGRDRFDPRTGYVATASSRCRSRRGDTLSAAVVAAPGFGPARELGIPQSGLYFVQVSVRAGPGAEDRLGHLLRHVSFGGTPIMEFPAAAGLPGRAI